MSDAESSFPWFRFYNEAAHDDKIEMIADDIDMDFITVLGAWTVIMSLASVSPKRGSLYVTDEIGHNATSISKKLKTSVNKSEKILTFFEKFGLILKNSDGFYYLPNWEKRQPKSDNSAPRVQKFRKEHTPKEQCNVTETLQKQECNVLDKDKDLDKDLDKDKDTGAYSTSLVQRIIERRAGIIINPGEIPILNRIEKNEPLEEDIIAALAYLKKMEVTAYRLSQLEKPIMVAKAQRIQSLLKPPTKSQSVSAHNDEFLKVEMAIALQQEVANV